MPSTRRHSPHENAGVVLRRADRIAERGTHLVPPHSTPVALCRYANKPRCDRMATLVGPDAQHVALGIPTLLLL